jgi:hypothetical protein
MNATSRLAWVLSLIAANAIAQNAYPNPDFNDVDGSAGWFAGTGSVLFQDEDASGCPASGNLGLLSEEISPANHDLFASGPCLTFAEATSFDARLFVRGGSGGSLSEVRVRAYANDACQGAAVDGIGILFGQLVDWTVTEGSFEVPAGGSIDVRAEGGGPDPVAVEIDEIRITAPGYLFFGDFDGGGVCRWSSGGG